MAKNVEKELGHAQQCFAPRMIYFLSKHTKCVSCGQSLFYSDAVSGSFPRLLSMGKLVLWQGHKVKISLGSGTFVTKRSSQWILLRTTKLLASATEKEVIAAPDGWDAVQWNADPGVHTLSSPAGDAANLACAKCLWGFLPPQKANFLMSCSLLHGRSQPYSEFQV